MPFTPFHMGVGMAAKAVAPRLISLQVFGVGQVLMDIEPGVRMVMDDDVLHGWTHTLWGSVPVALVTVLTWKLLEGRRVWRWTFEPLSTSTLWATAFFAVWSHVLLDVLIHHDMGVTRALIHGLGETYFSHEVIERACMTAAGAGLIFLGIRMGAAATLGAWSRFWTNVRAPAAWFSREPM